MKTKKIPMRRCVVSGDRVPKSDLLRFVRMPDGDVVVDFTGKVNGHGAYVKKDLTIIEKARDSKIIDKYLGVSVSDDVYEDAKKML